MRLTAEEIASRRGGVQVLHDITFAIEGGVLAVVGLNGSGKSTLLRTIAGVTPITSGRITLTIDGATLDVTGRRAHDLARAGVAYMQQNDQLFLPLTVMENLRLGGYLLERREVASKLAEVLSLIPGVATMLDRRAGVLSGGQRQMVALASVLMRNPKLLLVDEPSGGLSPVAAKEIYTVLSLLKDAGLTIILAEQNLVPALELADRVMVLYLGSAIDIVDAEALRADPGKLRGMMLGRLDNQHPDRD